MEAPAPKPTTPSTSNPHPPHSPPPSAVPEDLNNTINKQTSQAYKDLDAYSTSSTSSCPSDSDAVRIVRRQSYRHSPPPSPDPPRPQSQPTDNRMSREMNAFTSLNDVEFTKQPVAPPFDPGMDAQSRSAAMRRLRTASGSSMTFLQPGPITLIDHTVHPSERSAGLFAKSVVVGDYTVVSGSSWTGGRSIGGIGGVGGVGAYVCWNVDVETLEGQKIRIIKRYSEFDRLREQLKEAFPRAGASLPNLPPKSLVSKFRPRFLEKRRHGLNYFLSCILMNPEFSGSPLIKDFLFDRY